MTGKLKWASPQLRMEEEEHRKASWLILFYDLVFVIIIVRLTTIVDDDLTLEGVAKYAFLFIPIWWVWMGTTTYDHLFAIDDISHRVFIFLQMLPVVSLAVYVTDAMDGTSWEFTWAYVLARILLAALWLRAGYRNLAIWDTSRRLATGYTISILFWIASLGVDEPWRYVMWGIGLIVDLITPLFLTASEQQFIRTFGHLAERYGLIVLIVLGETIISVVRARAEAVNEVSISFGITGGLGMLLAFSIWWLYFDQVTDKYEHQTPRHVSAWGYMHLPLVMGIAAVGASMNFAVTGDPLHLPSNAHWLLAGGVACALLAFALFEWVGDTQPNTRSMLFRGGGALLALTFALIQNVLVKDQINSITLFLVLIVIVVVQIIQGHPSEDEEIAGTA